ncbi:MAG: hypothetical protein EHM72_09505 [Calditrichaeota bacterium]|nr:MAG: hypothetical protein EHM72_09505 [Calditrichota bacterium]
MRYSNSNITKSALWSLRIVMYFMAFYFFTMGLALILFPQFLTRAAGEPSGRILGMLRGAGGSIIPYSLMYILVAIKPLERRGFALIIACANILAVIIDFTSVYLKEYQISQAMIDVPFELLSLFVLVKFYSNQGVKQLLKN